MKLIWNPLRDIFFLFANQNAYNDAGTQKPVNPTTENSFSTTTLENNIPFNPIGTIPKILITQPSATSNNKLDVETQMPSNKRKRQETNRLCGADNSTQTADPLNPLEIPLELPNEKNKFSLTGSNQVQRETSGQQDQNQWTYTTATGTECVATSTHPRRYSANLADKAGARATSLRRMGTGKEFPEWTLSTGQIPGLQNLDKKAKEEIQRLLTHTTSNTLFRVADILQDYPYRTTNQANAYVTTLEVLLKDDQLKLHQYLLQLQDSLQKDLLKSKKKISLSS